MIELAVGIFLLCLLFGGKGDVVKSGENLGRTLRNTTERLADESEKLKK